MKTLEQRIEDFKNNSIIAAKEMMYENEGRLNPFLTVLAQELNGKFKTGVLSVPKDLINDTKALSMALPALISILQVTEQTSVKAFSFIAHANMVIIKKENIEENEPTDEDIRRAKRRDVLVAYLSTPVKKFCPLYIYDIKKTGKKVNKEGELVDEFDLIVDQDTIDHLSQNLDAEETSPFSDVWKNVDKLLNNEKEN